MIRTDLNRGSLSHHLRGPAEPKRVSVLPVYSRKIRMTSASIESIRESAWNKSLLLDGKEVVVPKARCVKRGEELVLRRDELLQSVHPGFCIIDPPFSSEETLKLGSKELVVSLREPVSRDDWKQVKLLRSFHYRGRPPFGRQGILLARIEKQEDAPEASGLIEIGSAPICNSARGRALNAPFKDDGISWEKWDYGTRGKYCKLIAEITRVVVHPDARGIGLGTLLLRGVVRYCRSHWQLAGYKPLFAEIVADMLRFHPFPLKAGFRYVGQTEGNLKRAARDIRYQLKQLSKGVDRDHANETSMERMQWRYARFLAKRAEKGGWDIGWALDTLKQMDRETLLRYLEVFEDVVRLPKPAYLRGLTRAANDFLRANIPSANRPAGKACMGPLRPLADPIVLRNVTVDECPSRPNTAATKEVCVAFGSLEQFSSRRILDIDCSIVPRSIVLVSGPSGSGKTTLFRVLSKDREPDSGRLLFPRNFQIGRPEDPQRDMPLVDTLGCTTSDALNILGRAGLSEPFLYLQSWDQLSDGQKERARIAMLLKSRANCWLIDNFGARLDTLSAQIVAAKFSYIARKFGITLFVATTRPAEIRNVIGPDVEIGLEVGHRAEVVNAS